ncbi:MAG: zinc-binding alcohol dehydrogenase family protein [Stenomitos frigidus ULC029]
MMKAITLNLSQSSNTSEWFSETEIETPVPSSRDLLVHVKAISVNPVDYKARASLPMQHPSKILGWDASGIVEAVGKEVTLFKPGDEVYYAGSFTRAGSNSEYHVVDERLVGKKPTSLSFEQAAALPLTTITAWEALFERLGIEPQTTSHNQSSTLLIIGGAGGVGSIAIQLAKQVAGMRVIATASRPETINWCQKMGADDTINHHHPFKSELATIGVDHVDYILCLHDTDQYLQNMVDVIKPQGKICSIVSTDQPFDLNLFFSKSVTFVWEMMFTKSMYETADIQSQHELLNRVATLIDRGILKTTLTENLGVLSSINLVKAHQLLAAGTTIGKVVLSGIH